MDQKTDRPSQHELEDLGQLELPIVESKPSKGTTVQVLGPDPYSVTKFIQVHNRLETPVPGAPFISMYGGKSKPPGFGNPGGGIELNELELFKANESEWFKYYDSFGTLNSADLEIIGCAFRESKDESGFCDFEVVLDEDTKKPIILTDYYYKEGHRVLTVWGKYNSYQQRPRREVDEIDDVDWTDFSMSMFEVYKRLRREFREPPVYPYWSHLRRILSGLSVIDRYNWDRDERSYPIRRLIHPSWRTVYPVGRGNKNFPVNGYPIIPEDWYHMLDIMLEKGIEDLDNDTLLTEFNGKSKVKILVFDKLSGKYNLKEREKDLNLAGKIALMKEQQERQLEKEAGIVRVSDAGQSGGEALTGSEDYTGIPTLAEAIDREDKEYFEILEREFGSEWYRS